MCIDWLKKICYDRMLLMGVTIWFYTLPLKKSKNSIYESSLLLSQEKKKKRVISLTTGGPTVREKTEVTYIS